MARKSKADIIQEAWEEWKKTKDPKHLETILDNYNWEVHVRKFYGSKVPPEVLKTYAWQFVLEGIDEYDPSKGASLKTYLDFQMKKLRRITNELQRMGRIPENRALKIREFEEALSELRFVLGREPSDQELADKLGWPLVEVKRMKRDLRAEWSFGDVESVNVGDDASLMDAIGEANIFGTRIVDAFYLSLSPVEQRIFEGLTGYGGTPKKSVKELADELGLSQAQVYNIRNKIAKRLKAWIHGLE